MNEKRAFVMTRQRTWILTAISVAVFVLLSWIFADGLFRGPLWNAEDWVSSPLITYLLIGVIVLVGWYQASRLPAAGVPLQDGTDAMTTGQVADPVGWRPRSLSRAGPRSPTTGSASSCNTCSTTAGTPGSPS